MQVEIADGLIATDSPLALQEWVDARRFRTYPVSKQLVIQALQRGTLAVEIVDGALPEDAALLEVHYDGWTIRLVFASESFDPVPDGESIPEVLPMFRVTNEGEVSTAS